MVTQGTFARQSHRNNASTQRPRNRRKKKSDGRELNKARKRTSHIVRKRCDQLSLRLHSPAGAQTLHILDEDSRGLDHIGVSQYHDLKVNKHAKRSDISHFCTNKTA